MIFTKDLILSDIIKLDAPYDLVKHVNNVERAGTSYVKGETRSSEKGDNIAKWEEWLIKNKYAEEENSTYKFTYGDKIEVQYKFGSKIELIFVEVSAGVLKLFKEYNMTNRYTDEEIKSNQEYTHDQICEIFSIKNFKVL